MFQVDIWTWIFEFVILTLAWDKETVGKDVNLSNLKNNYMYRFNHYFIMHKT